MVRGGIAILLASSIYFALTGANGRNWNFRTISIDAQILALAINKVYKFHHFYSPQRSRVELVQTILCGRVREMAKALLWP